LFAGHAEEMNQAQALVIVAAELRLFLRPGRRGGPVRVTVDGTSSLGHVVQSLGVPLTEAGRLLVNGEPALPGYRPGSGDVVTVDPVRRPQHLEPARFVLDVHQRFRGTGRLREPGTRGATRRAQPGGCARPAARQGGCGCMKDVRGRGTGGSGAARLSWRRTRWEDQDAMSTDLTVTSRCTIGARLCWPGGLAGV